MGNCQVSSGRRVEVEEVVSDERLTDLRLRNWALCEHLSARPGQNARRAMPLLDGVAGPPGTRAIVSFPGMYQDTWNGMVGLVRLLKKLDSQAQHLSTACIFLPDGDPRFGQHAENVVDQSGQCFCYKIYGGIQRCGCLWFDVWRKKLHEVLACGQTPVVVYKAGQEGEGDQNLWDNFPVVYSQNRPGLGGSQAGEVAFLRRLVGDNFMKMDVRQAEWDFLRFLSLRESLPAGIRGVRHLAAAVADCPEAQLGLQALQLEEFKLSEEAAEVLSSTVLPKFLHLQTVDLKETALGGRGCQGLLRALPRHTGLKRLDLSCNPLRDEGVKTLAQVIPQLPLLEGLWLELCSFGPEGMEALAGSLPQLAALTWFVAVDNPLGPRGVSIIAAYLEVLAQSNRNSHRLVLRWEGCGLGAPGAEVNLLAVALQDLPDEVEINLTANNFGDSARDQLRLAKPTGLRL